MRDASMRTEGSFVFCSAIFASTISPLFASAALAAKSASALLTADCAIKGRHAIPTATAAVAKTAINCLCVVIGGCFLAPQRSNLQARIRNLEVCQQWAQVRAVRLRAT